MCPIKQTNERTHEEYIVKSKWKPNIDRLVRSAMYDERYCSYMMDVLHSEDPEILERARVSNLTVHEFLRQEKKMRTNGDTYANA